MKNFLDLLATDLTIDIVVVANDQIDQYSVPLLEPIKIAVAGNLTELTIDGFDAIPFAWHQDNVWHFEIDQPFYQWRHQITGQGWLLRPQM